MKKKIGDLTFQYFLVNTFFYMFLLVLFIQNNKTFISFSPYSIIYLLPTNKTYFIRTKIIIQHGTCCL